MALVKGSFDDGGNSYADVSDWLDHFPAGVGYDGAVLEAALGVDPVDQALAAHADARLISASRWVDAQGWTTGEPRVYTNDDAGALPPLLSLPRLRWYMGAGSPYIAEGTFQESVPSVVVAAVVEVAEVLRLSGCLNAFDVRNPADVLRAQDVAGHVEQTWAAPLAGQSFEPALQYLRGLVHHPGSVRRGFAW